MVQRHNNTKCQCRPFVCIWSAFESKSRTQSIECVTNKQNAHEIKKKETHIRGLWHQECILLFDGRTDATHKGGHTYMSLFFPARPSHSTRQQNQVIRHRKMCFDEDCLLAVNCVCLLSVVLCVFGVT